MSSIQSVQRAFDVLGTLADGPLGVTRIAARTRLPKSTTARLLGTLMAEGAVEQLPGESRYRLGPRLAELGVAVRPTRGLVAVARPHLEALAERVGEAVGLSVAEGDLVRYVDQVSVSHEVQVRDWTGARIAMHAVSSGLVFLAHRSPAELERFLGRPLERFTARTVTDPLALRERLRRVQLDGVAWTIEEYAVGLASVAAGVADGDGEVVAAVHVHGPAYRFPGERRAGAAAAARLVETVAHISSQLRGPA